MNERIKQLIEQATIRGEEYLPGNDGHPTPTTYFDKEKFAELIVAECTEQVRGQYIPVMEDKEMMKDTHWDGYVQCGVDSVVGIREYFYGVEQ